jgi:hypothetical protein
LVKQYLSYALGRPLLADEAAPSAALLETFRDNDHNLPELLVSYVASPAFALKRSAETAP